jgi:uncharacterized protein (TIGR02996 family)
VSKVDGILRAICENPDDDGPRLVYADWCEEQGDADRAEFIRLQCQLEAGDPFAPGRRAQFRREWQLLQRHGERWIRDDGLADIVDPRTLGQSSPNSRFRRGFLDRAWFMSPDDFLRAAPRLFARAPVTGIALWGGYTIPPESREWFQNTYMTVYLRENGYGPYQGLQEPAGTDFPEPVEFRRMVESPWFVRLRAFAMNTIYADRRHVELLGAWLAARQLRELDLSGTFCIAGEGWEALARAPICSGLQSLGLDRCHLGLDGLQHVVNCPHLAQLRRLSLEADPTRTAVGPAGIQLLCAAQALTGLRELNLYGQGGGAQGLRTLAEWPGLARLTRLDLSHFYGEYPGAGPMPPAFAAFVRSPHWEGLRELNLEGGQLGDLEAFLDGPNLATLRVLTFAYEFHRYDGYGEVPLQDEAAALLARCPHFADGLEVHIAPTGLTKKGLRLLGDRFGDGLILYPDNRGRHRQPGDWASGRPSWSTFAAEEPGSGKPDRS